MFYFFQFVLGLCVFVSRNSCYIAFSWLNQHETTQFICSDKVFVTWKFYFYFTSFEYILFNYFFLCFYVVICIIFNGFILSLKILWCIRQVIIIVSQFWHFIFWYHFLLNQIFILNLFILQVFHTFLTYLTIVTKHFSSFLNAR